MKQGNPAEPKREHQMGPGLPLAMQKAIATKGLP